MTPTWAFLDVGNVLLDEDRLTFASFRVHAEAVRKIRPDVTFGRLLQEREAFAKAGSRWPLYDAISRYLDEGGCLDAWEAASREIRANFAELSPSIPGAFELIRSLSARYRLGVIANQGGECRARLVQLGCLSEFSVVALSEEVGAAKPNPELFRWALERAGIGPSDAWMVGDRLDNDIAPAAQLGMKTAWVRWPDRSAKGWSPADVHGRAYLRSLERVARAEADRPDRPRPTVESDDLWGLWRPSWRRVLPDEAGRSDFDHWLL